MKDRKLLFLALTFSAISIVLSALSYFSARQAAIEELHARESAFVKKMTPVMKDMYAAMGGRGMEKTPETLEDLFAPLLHLSELVRGKDAAKPESKAKP